jgi:hypothetical protein
MRGQGPEKLQKERNQFKLRIEHLPAVYQDALEKHAFLAIAMQSALELIALLRIVRAAQNVCRQKARFLCQQATVTGLIWSP